MTKRKTLTLSPTQLETWELCRRKWWLGAIRKLPRASSKSQLLGTILHAVIERYQLADDQGRDPETGREVDLYPEGWHIARNRHTNEYDGEISPAEQDLVKKLVTAGIASGIIERPPNRLIEYAFHRTIEDIRCQACEGKGCEACESGGRIAKTAMTGFVDVATPDGIQDHKTTKNLRYAKNADPKSPNFLGRNLQALIYAHHVVSALQEAGEEVPSQFLLRHNVFVTDPSNPIVRKVEVQVTPEYLQEQWQSRVVEPSHEMISVREKTDKWSDIPDPPKMVNACNAYGGCEFLSICSGRESEEAYERRITKSMQLTALERNDSMSLKDKLAQRKAVMQATPTEEVSEKEELQTEEAKPNDLAPPWAIADCRACGGLGFNKLGGPCRMCDINTSKKNKPTSAEFILEPTGNGTVAWQLADDDSVSGESPLPAPAAAQTPATVKVQEKIELPEVEAPKPETRSRRGKKSKVKVEDKELEESADQSEPATDVESVEGDDETSSGDEDGEKGTLPSFEKKGFILCVHCCATRAKSKAMNRRVIRLEDILQQYGDDLAKESKAASFYELAPFDRRDALAVAAPAICDLFGTSIVTASASTPDMKALIAAVRPFADMVIVPEPE